MRGRAGPRSRAGPRQKSLAMPTPPVTLRAEKSLFCTAAMLLRTAKPVRCVWLRFEMKI